MRKFYIIANKDNDKNYTHAINITNYIISKGCECKYQESTSVYNIAEVNNIPKGTECVLVLGGDGTLIQAARDLADGNIPVFGINIGNLGFLTEIDMSEVYPAIDNLINDNYYLDKRMLLTGDVVRNGEIVYSADALNDIVLNRMGPLRIIHFDIYVNNEFLISYRADGLIVSTPTGSTAYNLSAGGPIMRPGTENMVMTPICPHMLNKSSVVFSSEDVLEIRLNECDYAEEKRIVNFDGDSYFELLKGDRIIIKNSDKKAYFIRTEKYNFLQILRNKLS